MIKIYARHEAGAEFRLIDDNQPFPNKETAKLVESMKTMLTLMIAADMGWTGIAFQHPDGAALIAIETDTRYNYEKIVDCTMKLLLQITC